MNFPIFKTKIPNINQIFNLEDPRERQKYFRAKAGAEIQKIQDFLKTNTFVAFLIGPKNSGKGTYSKLFAEVIGKDKIRHISVGDIVRDANELLKNEFANKELKFFLEKNYRGFIPLDEATNAIFGRSTKTLVPTEIILSLIEWEISKSKKKAIFIDGFPRKLDQISYSLYFSNLMGYRDDPDFFIFINVPETVIDERIKYRVICPKCHTPRNKKLLRTKKINRDKNTKEFQLICDDPNCQDEVMMPKEGDELGIEAIRDRIEIDRKVMETLIKIEGVPKVYLRNSVPVKDSKENLDDYEITPGYNYQWNEQEKKVEVIEKPWTIKDDEGEESHSLLPAPVVLSLIKQVAKVLGL